MNKRLAATALLVAASGTWQGAPLLLAQTASTAPAAANAPAAGNFAFTEPAELTDSNSTFFESESAGISLRIPAGLRIVPASGAGDDIAQYADPDRKWEIKLQRTVHKDAMPLLSTVGADGKPVTGMLDTAARGMRLNLAGFIVRQDTVNIADPGAGAGNHGNNVGMLAVRYTSGGSRYLLQQALVWSNPKTYFSIVLQTPIGDGKLDDEASTALEVIAVKTFGRMLDSVHLLDTAALSREQKARLLRTQILLTQLHSHSLLKNAMLDQQWLRVMRNGRDVGYSYVTEQNADGPLKTGKPDNKGEGLLIGIRGRSLIAPGMNNQAAAPNKIPKPMQIDVASWWFLSEDQNTEEWSRVTVTTELEANGKPARQPKQQQYTEFGSTRIDSHLRVDRDAMPGQSLDRQQPPVNMRQTRMLEGTSIDPTGASKPFMQPLPIQFYLPQAMSTMLPRLLPLRPDVDNSPRTYMFTMYVPDNGKVMSRYVEVGDEGDFNLGNERIRAIPITDRLGWHGSITTHYVSPAGVYMGSENKDTHTTTRVTTAEELSKIWKNADLTQPGAIDRPRPAAAPLREIPPARGMRQGPEIQGPPSPIR